MFERRHFAFYNYFGNFQESPRNVFFSKKLDEGANENLPFFIYYTEKNKWQPYRRN